MAALMFPLHHQSKGHTLSPPPLRSIVEAGDDNRLEGHTWEVGSYDYQALAGSCADLGCQTYRSAAGDSPGLGRIGSQNGNVEQMSLAGASYHSFWADSSGIPSCVPRAAVAGLVAAGIHWDCSYDKT